MNGERVIPLVNFLRGPGQTGIRENELIHHISFEVKPKGMITLFRRLGNRAGMSVSIASCAIAINKETTGCVEDIRIAVGAVAPTAMRCPEAEQVLHRRILSDVSIDTAADVSSRECSPIDDVRASADYRRLVIYHLVRRALNSVMEVA
jgi:CO/xanthine dehydrogenase FAD-binding subunit